MARSQQAEAANLTPPIAPGQPPQTANVGQPPPQTQPSPTGQPGAAPTGNVQVAGAKKPAPPERPTIAPDVSPTLSGVVDSDAVHNLPLADRDFTTLALLVPGTYPLEQGSALEGASLVVNGIRGNMNNSCSTGQITTTTLQPVASVSDCRGDARIPRADQHLNCRIRTHCWWPDQRSEPERLKSLSWGTL